MANNQDTYHDKDNQETFQDENEGFEVTNRGQNLGGGKEQDGGQKAGLFNEDDELESQTDQSIAQAAPGQTANSTNQGSSNA